MTSRAPSTPLWPAAWLSLLLALPTYATPSGDQPNAETAVETLVLKIAGFMRSKSGAI